MLANFNFIDSKDPVGTLKVLFVCSIAYFAIHSTVLAYWNF